MKSIINHIYILIKTNLDSENNYCRNSFDYTLTFISFNQLYLELKNITKQESNKNKILVTFCSDPSISASIIPVCNEFESNVIIQPNFKLDCKYPEYKSKLRIIKFTSNLYHNYKNSFDNLIELDNDIKHQMILKKEQFIILGLDQNDEKICSYSKDELTIDKLEKILKFIKSNIEDYPIFIDINLSVFNQSLSPLCLRHPDEIINPENSVNINNLQLKLFLKYLSKFNICGINISGFCVDFNDITLTNRIQIETIQQIYGSLLNIKEKKINIYNENSRFLIFKPLQEIYDDIDQFGWYIMRNVDSDLKDKLLKDITDGEIITIQIEDDDMIKRDILISVTTLADQNDLSYYFAEDYSDKRLYPDEKLDAYFNLIV